MVQVLTEATINDIVELAIKEAPVTEAVKTASADEAKSENKVLKVCDYLDKIAGEIESKEKSSLTDFKTEQSEKKAEFEEIINTYVELETN